MRRAAATKGVPGGARAHVKRYFAGLSPSARRVLKKVRDDIRAAAPEAEEHFSYGVPGFRLDGKSLVWYAAWKEHVSLYPMTAAIREQHADALAGYEMSTGTIRFPIDRPPSTTLVRRLVRARMAEVRRGTRR